VVFGAVLGVLVSLCSVGAGALGVAVLFFLYPRLPPVRIVGSDLAHAVPLTLVAGLGHWLIGSVDWYIVGALLLGSLPGISIGSHLAARISDRFLLPVLASILVADRPAAYHVINEYRFATVRMPIAGDGGACGWPIRAGSSVGHTERASLLHIDQPDRADYDLAVRGDNHVMILR